MTLKMKKIILILLIYLVACLILNLIVCDNCCEINSQQLPYYKLMKSNARSNQLILSRTSIKNVNECRKFASNKKALAFNYGIENNDGKISLKHIYIGLNWIIMEMHIRKLFLFI